MTALCEDLSGDELALFNEVMRSTLILTGGLAPERRAMIAVHVSAAFTGVVMAVESYPVRKIDSHLLDTRSSKTFEEVKNRACIHAFDERANGPRTVSDVFRDWMGEGRISVGELAQRKLWAM